MMKEAWIELAIEPTRDVRSIKRAYAARLKQCHPEDDPEGFRRLNDAYQAALTWAGGTQQRPVHADVSGPAPQPVVAVGSDAVESPPDEAAEPAVAPVAFNPADDAHDVINALVNGGEAEAVVALDTALARHEYVSLHAREGLEASLLAQMATLNRPPHYLMAVACNRFGWHEGRHPLQRIFPHEMNAAVHAHEYFSARSWLEDMAETGAGSGLDREIVANVANVLLGRIPPNHKTSRTRQFPAIMRDMISQLRQRFPLAGMQALDEKAWQHWQTRLDPRRTELDYARALGAFGGLIGVLLGMFAGFFLAELVGASDHLRAASIVTGAALLAWPGFRLGLFIYDRMLPLYFRVDDFMRRSQLRWGMMHFLPVLAIVLAGAPLDGKPALVSMLLVCVIVARYCGNIQAFFSLFVGTLLAAFTLLGKPVESAGVVNPAAPLMIGLAVVLLSLEFNHWLTDRIRVPEKLTSYVVWGIILLGLWLTRMLIPMIGG